LSNKFLIVIAGPTAVGKTALAIHLARHFNTEIISADSRQFYRELNIGTAKPAADELKLAKHHFINSISIQDEYNVGMFEEDALLVLQKVFSAHPIAILCGGSGLYIDAVCNGMDNLPQQDAGLRQELNQLYKQKGIDALRNHLKELDPVFYEEADTDNPHRMIRAIEVCLISKKPYSELRKKQKAHRPFHIIKIGIEDDREIVYQKINERVDKMIADGLIEEAKSLFEFRHLNALQTVGYKELFDYFDSKTTIDEAINLIKQHTRNYAKRQWTWFRRDKEIKWFKSNEEAQIIDYMNKAIDH
jgi:tRNA dimethylallyltransferase